jgi:hypothetical protein
MTKQTNLLKQQGGKDLILSEADRKFNKEVARIKADLLTSPAPEKYIQSELDIIDRILRKNYRDCCTLVVIKGGFKEWYFESGRFDYPLQYIKLIRHHHRMFLSGKINFIGEELTDKAKVIADAIMFFKLEEWLTARRDGREDQTEIHSLIKAGRDQGNFKIIDSLLLKCREEISHIASFNSKSYAALYYIISEKYKSIFKTEVNFTDLQRQLDQYFGQDTTSYKPSKLISAAETLKSKYQWADQI